MIPILIGALVAVVHCAVALVVVGYFPQPHLPVISSYLGLVLIGAPILEEIIHRGPLLWTIENVDYWKARGWVRSRRLTLILVFLIQAAIFGFFHLGYHQWERVVSAMNHGVIAGILVWRFRTLKTAVAYHVVWNLLTTVL